MKPQSSQDLQSDLDETISQSRSLWDHLDLAGAFSKKFDEELAEKRWNRWCDCAAGGDQKKFASRLKRMGYNPSAVKLALGTAAEASQDNLPEWASTLREVTDAAQSSNIILLNSQPGKKNFAPLPFEDLFYPALSVARKNLNIALEKAEQSAKNKPGPIARSRLQPGFLCDLEYALLKEIAFLSERALLAEFSALRPQGITLLAQLSGGAINESSEHYRAFIEPHLKTGLRSIFFKYPALARLLANAIRSWVDASAEFLNRLRVDLPQIRKKFRLPKDAEITGVETGLSDPHNGGRTVMAIEFENGSKVIYKPKDVHLENAFYKLLQWFTERGFSPGFRAPLESLPRRGYGWMEYVSHKPCKDEAALHRFYQRAGGQLCLLYLLGSNDCHHENLIASGEYPILVDAETLLHPQPDLPENTLLRSETLAETTGILEDSVLRVGMLPVWQVRSNGMAVDNSGLANYADIQPSIWKGPRWKAINTDWMHIAYESAPAAKLTSLPFIGSSPIAADSFSDDFVTGFQAMYDLVVNNREVLLASNGPLHSFQNATVRFIFRNTRVYGILCEKSVDPDNLRNGIDRDIELDVLARAFLHEGKRPRTWPVLQAEHRALSNLNIPLFTASSSSKTLRGGVPRPIANFFKDKSWDRMIARLNRFDSIDRNFQSELIRGTFLARKARTGDNARPSANCHESTVLQDVDIREFLTEAVAIGEEVRRHAISGKDGSALWLGLEFIPQAKRFQFQALGDEFYSGRTGIALFLSALDYVRGTSENYEFVHNALSPLAKLLATGSPEILHHYSMRKGVGGGMGLGSVVYCYSLISLFYDEMEFRKNGSRCGRPHSLGIKISKQQCRCPLRHCRSDTRHRVALCGCS